MKKATLAMAIVFAFTIFFLPSHGTCHADAPKELVHRMLEEVMSIQSDPKLQGQEFREKRRVSIKGVIARNFDTARMAEEALGGHWKELNATQRIEFKKIFEDLFQDSYTRLVLDFLGQEKIVYGKEEIGRGGTEVPTTIQRTNEAIPVDYVLGRGSDRWLVHDVKIDGVSIVGNYRRTFARVIKRESYEALVEKMRLQQQAIGKSS